MADELLRSLYLQGKVVLVGDSGVGKTAIFNSFSDGMGFGEFRKTWTTPKGDNLVVRDKNDMLVASSVICIW